MLTVVVFGYMIRAAEIPYMSVSEQDWLPLSNAGWYIIITMTTGKLAVLILVGYGDFYPTTYIGRCIGVCVGVWGSFLISFFVVMVATHLGLSH